MRKPETIFAVLLVVAGALSLALQRWVFVDPTAQSDWADAASWVEARIDERDVFRIEPWWYERALTHFVAVGARADRIRTPLLEDLYRYEDVFVVAQADRLDRALAALPFAAEPVETHDFGTVRTARVPVPTDAFRWELLEHLGDATVTRVRGAHVERCDRWNPRERRWDCGPQARWLYVGEELREVGDDPRRCVWAHPLDHGRTLRIASTVPPADTIRVRGSFDLRAARLPRDGAVLMQVFVNDTLAHERHVEHDDHSWTPFDIDVSEIEGPVELRVEIDLKGSIKDRYFCVNAWAK